MSMDIRSRHNINMVDIIFDLRGVFGMAMGQDIVGIPSKGIVSSRSIGVYNWSVVISMAMSIRNMDIRSRHNVNMVEIIFGLRGVFGMAMGQDIVGIPSKGIVSSRSIGVYNWSVVISMAMSIRNMDIRSRHNVNMVDIVFDFRSVFSVTVRHDIIGIPSKSRASSMAVGVHSWGIVSTMGIRNMKVRSRNIFNIVDIIFDFRSVLGKSMTMGC